MIIFTVYREIRGGLRVRYQLGHEGGVSFPKSDEDAIDYIAAMIRDRKADGAAIVTSHTPDFSCHRPYPARDLQAMRELVAEQTGIPVE